MDMEEFKKIVHETLLANGFIKKKTQYYKENDQVISVLGLQRSSYSNSYYINIGIIIKEIHPDLKYPKYYDGDLRSRFVYELNGKKTACLELDEVNDRVIVVSALEKGISDFIVPLEEKGVLYLIEKEPYLLYSMSGVAREHLGFVED